MKRALLLLLLACPLHASVKNIASATTITLHGTGVYRITGTATIQTINGVSDGDVITLLPDAAFGMGSAGNIWPLTTTATAGRPITLVVINGTVYEAGPSTASGIIVPISIGNGGTGQTTAPAAFDALAPTTTKGDLIARTTTGNTRVAVTSDGDVLTADSASAAGVKFAPAPAGAGGTQYAEDTVAADAESLTMAGVVRNDTPSSLVSANGDRGELQIDASGRLWVNGSNVTQPISNSNLDAALSTLAKSLQLPAALDASGYLKTHEQGTATVSGTVAVSNSFALDATLTGGTQTTRITDGTNTATVKAASTAAVAADKALVVAVSPNNTVGVSGTVTANAGTNLNTSALALDATLTGGTARTKVTDGTNNAAVKAASTAAAATDPALVVAVSPNNSVAVTQATGSNLHVVNDAGSAVIGHVIADSGSTTAVTGNVTVVQPTGTNMHVVVDTAPTISINQTQMNSATISVGQGVSDTGTQRVTQSQELTYSAGLTLKTATAAGTAPFFSICGSASKTIVIQRFSVSGTVGTAAVWGDVILKRTSTATSGGTATTLTNLPYDSTSAAGTAVVKYYTVLPTAGTSAGVIDAQTQLFPVTTISSTLQPTPAPLVWKWRDPDSQAPTLRGTAQCMEASFGTTTTNAPTLTVSVAWTEK